MNTLGFIGGIIERLRVVLDTHSIQLECFDKYAVQVEGWLKGELLPLLLTEKENSRLVDLNTECKCGLGQRRVDYWVVLNDGVVGNEVWIELKHWQIGYQGESRWKAFNYFSDRSIGIYNDVLKLSNISKGNKYLLILATKNPKFEEDGDWEKGIIQFNKKYQPLIIKSLTKPSDFPRFYFLGLLEVV